MFHYSQYWKCWSRRLATSEGRFIDITVTPISSCGRENWQEIAEEKIRVHSTRPGKGDRAVAQLPQAVYNDIVKNLGADFALRLTTFDYFTEVSKEEITLANEKSLKGGGVPLELIKAQR